MAKVTIILEDSEDGSLKSGFDVYDPGRDYKTINESPTPAEAVGLGVIEMLKEVFGGVQVGFTDDAEYHAKDGANG